MTLPAAATRDLQVIAPETREQAMSRSAGIRGLTSALEEEKVRRACRRSEEIRHLNFALWEGLADAQDDEDHLALGYRSWDQYCREEHGYEHAHAYRLPNAGRVLRRLRSIHLDTRGLTEAHARPLWRLLRWKPVEMDRIARTVIFLGGWRAVSAPKAEAMARQVLPRSRSEARWGRQLELLLPGERLDRAGRVLRDLIDPLALHRDQVREELAGLRDRHRGPFVEMLDDVIRTAGELKSWLQENADVEREEKP
jgi:hypothetical protein